MSKLSNPFSSKPNLNLEKPNTILFASIQKLLFQYLRYVLHYMDPKNNKPYVDSYPKLPPISLLGFWPTSWFKHQARLWKWYIHKFSEPFLWNYPWLFGENTLPQLWGHKPRGWYPLGVPDQQAHTIQKIDILIIWRVVVLFPLILLNNKSLRDVQTIQNRVEKVIPRALPNLWLLKRSNKLIKVPLKQSLMM